MSIREPWLKDSENLSDIDPVVISSDSPLRNAGQHYISFFTIMSWLGCEEK